MGRLLLLQEGVASDLILGPIDQWGKDHSETYRRVHKVIDAIIAVPAGVEERRAWAEDQLGLSLAPLDNAN
jgi:hypothetical protein